MVNNKQKVSSGTSKNFRGISDNEEDLHEFQSLPKRIKIELGQNKDNPIYIHDDLSSHEDTPPLENVLNITPRAYLQHYLPLTSILNQYCAKEDTSPY
ncbi:10440_t:CDS:2, partial [Acaulospora colombiana]